MDLDEIKAEYRTITTFTLQNLRLDINAFQMQIPWSKKSRSKHGFLWE